MQSATERPDPSLQRKAAIAAGGPVEHTGAVRIQPIPNFDLDRTIFQTLEGRLARFVMRTRVGREPVWEAGPAAQVNQAYAAIAADRTLPAIDPALLAFMAAECDFDVEHADGSFLDHLYFCFEYTAAHYPQGSALVMLLHSILGTGTNTFAMTADKMPALQALLDPADWAQIEAFPSVLRLLYDGPLRAELRANLTRLDQLRAIRFHRVIDNAPIEMSGPAFVEALNYQLIHLVDFLPVANWATHQNDTAAILFRDLHDLMAQGRLQQCTLSCAPPSTQPAQGEIGGLGAWFTTHIPVGLSEKMAAKSVRRFSQRVGHDLSYTIDWG